MTRAFGVEFTRPFYLGVLADSLLRAGAADEGLATIEEAMALVEKNEDRFYEAELRRLWGELLALQGREAHRDQIEALFNASLATAQQQQARSLALRTATSLCRWHAGTDREGEALATLEAIYQSFNEGHDTADLKAAAALLA